MKVLFMFFALLNVAFFTWQIDLFNLQKPKASAKQITQDPNIPQLALLKEVSKEDLKAIQAKEKTKPKPTKVAKVKNPPPRPKAGQPICYSLGPFDGMPQAQNISTKLQDLGAYTVERSITAEVPMGYWVYLPSFDSWKTAKDKVAKLEDDGIKDMFIVGRGAMKNAVSLGLFKSEDGAKERIAKLKSMGEKPKIQTQYKQMDQYWIDIDVEPDKDQVVTTIEKIAQSLTVLELNSRKCD